MSQKSNKNSSCFERHDTPVTQAAPRCARNAVASTGVAARHVKRRNGWQHESRTANEEAEPREGTVSGGE